MASVSHSLDINLDVMHAEEVVDDLTKMERCWCWSVWEMESYAEEQWRLGSSLVDTGDKLVLNFNTVMPHEIPLWLFCFFLSEILQKNLLQSYKEGKTSSRTSSQLLHISPLIAHYQNMSETWANDMHEKFSAWITYTVSFSGMTSTALCFCQILSWGNFCRCLNSGKSLPPPTALNKFAFIFSLIKS